MDDLIFHDQRVGRMKHRRSARGSAITLKYVERFRERFGGVFMAQSLWVMKNEVVPLALPANAGHRRSAGLTFQRKQPKVFLDTRMNKKISRGDNTERARAASAHIGSGNIFASCLRFTELIFVRRSHRQSRANENSSVCAACKTSKAQII